PPATHTPPARERRLCDASACHGVSTLEAPLILPREPRECSAVVEVGCLLVHPFEPVGFCVRRAVPKHEEFVEARLRVIEKPSLRVVGLLNRVFVLLPVSRRCALGFVGRGPFGPVDANDADAERISGTTMELRDLV